MKPVMNIDVYCALFSLMQVSSLHYAALKEVLESVSRRLGGDSYFTSNSMLRSICHDDSNLTLLVNETRCAKNEELFNGNWMAIAVGSNIVEVGSTLFYILIGAGSGILILLFIILIMFLSVFAIACFQNRQKRKLSSCVIAIAQPQNQGTTSPYR